MKRSAFQQQEVISTENNQNEIDLKKIKLEEVSLPPSSCVEFQTFCKNSAKKKLQNFKKSGK